MSVSYSTYGWLDHAGRSVQDIRALADMERGSEALLKAMWKRHPAIMRERTGRMVGP